MTDLEYEILSQLIRIVKLRTQRYLEIGSYHGRSLQVVCDSNSEMEVRSIDKRHSRKLLRNIKRYPQIKLHKCNSEFADWENLGKFDIILVDGDHGRRMAGIDIRNSWEAWNQKGIFIVDDYIAPGVFDAVNDFFGITIKEESPGREYIRKSATSHKRAGKPTPEASPEEVLDDACMFRSPKHTSKQKYSQVFGMLFVCFSDEVYKQSYDNIRQMAYKILSSDTESSYYLNRVHANTPLGYRLPFVLPSQEERELSQNQ